MPEYSWEDFKNKLQMMAEQGGPLPSAWSPEAIAEAQRRADMIGIAEFRPANARENRLSQLSNMYNIANNEPEINAMYGRGDKSYPVEYLSRIKEIIGKKFSAKDWTNQVESKNYETGMYDKFFKDDPNKIAKNLSNERIKDAKKAGYNVTEDIGIDSWDRMNKANNASDEFVYHVTPEKNLTGISENGIIPSKKTGIKPNFSQDAYKNQTDKSFFTSDPIDTKNYLFRDDPTSTIRTKRTSDLLPDLHQDSAANWYQTKNPVSPQNLEIETAPGQWQNLIDYMKSRGGK